MTTEEIQQYIDTAISSKFEGFPLGIRGDAYQREG